MILVTRREMYGSGISLGGMPFCGALRDVPAHRVLHFSEQG